MVSGLTMYSNQGDWVSYLKISPTFGLLVCYARMWFMGSFLLQFNFYYYYYFFVLFHSVGPWHSYRS